MSKNYYNFLLTFIGVSIKNKMIVDMLFKILCPNNEVLFFNPLNHSLSFYYRTDRTWLSFKISYIENEGKNLYKFEIELDDNTIISGMCNRQEEIPKLWDAVVVFHNSSI